MYVPDDLQEDLDLLKRLRIQGKAYNIILYCKEENERKESSKENKEKEENKQTNKSEISKKKNEIPTLEEVLEYGRKLNVTDDKLRRFFNIYDSVGWVTEKNLPIKKWWKRLELWLNDKGKDNVTKTNQQRHAAGAVAQVGSMAGAEEHRRENMEKHLASHHPGDDRLAGLARQINEVAQEVGVSTAEYSLQQIAYDAQSLLYKFVWCQGWTDERWREVMQQVARRLKKAAQPGQKAKLDSNALFEMVFGLATRIRN